MKLVFTVALALVVVRPLAAGAADLSVPQRVIMSPAIVAGGVATSGVQAALALLDVTVGIPAACAAQGVADGSFEGCGAGASTAFSAASRAHCDAVRSFVEACTVGLVNPDICQTTAR